VIETVDTHCELPQAQLFGAQQLADNWRQPLNDPVWTDVYDHLRDDDPVLGLYLGRRAWALPWWIMKEPHAANLSFDDRPVLVTLCVMCSSASAFRAEVEGEPLVFRLRGKYNGSATLVRPLDGRLPHNTLVLGVENAAKARAYPLQALARIGPVLNDSLGGAEIVLMCRPGTLQGLAFRRRVGDRVLIFRHSETRGVYDEQTGSVWNEMGEAISGPLAGTRLAYLESGVGEWYQFAASHPDTEIYKAP
jgi:hypothetical protein